MTSTNWRKLRQQIASTAGQLTLPLPLSSEFDHPVLVSADPFLKWAGGKRQLMSELSALAPRKIERYFEPFLGAGALFFFLMPKGKINSSAYISDINTDLINVYTAIRDDHRTLIDSLRQHDTKYQNDPNYYYQLRDEYNSKSCIGTQRAAQLITLNNTCFNGLYRVNSSGDFIYLDPPYHAVSNTAYFTGYNVGEFLEQDQKNLADVFKQLDEMKCNVMLTNSNTQFIRDLYCNFVISL